MKESAINPLSIPASALSGKEPAKNADRFQPQAQKETEALNDLEVSEQNETAIIGGPGGYGNNSPLFNHNETTAEEEADELDDLSVSDAAEVKGGPSFKRIRIGVMSFGEEGAES